MKSLALVVGLLLSWLANSGHASTQLYDLSINLKMNGKHFPGSRMLVSAGETATITKTIGKKKTFVDVVANEGEIHGHKGILLNFTVGELDNQGHKRILSKPRILARHNEPASISVADTPKGKRPSKTPALALSVLAKRRNL